MKTRFISPEARKRFLQRRLRLIKKIMIKKAMASKPSEKLLTFEEVFKGTFSVYYKAFEA